MRTIATTIACLLVAGAVTPAVAMTQPLDTHVATTAKLDVRSVDFRDRDQVRAVYKRLQQSSLFVCGADPNADTVRQEEVRACSKRAMDQAVQSINRPMLTALNSEAGAPMLARGY